MSSALVPSALVGLVVCIVSGLGLLEDNPLKRKLDRYRAWWRSTVRDVGADDRLHSVPSLQLAAMAVTGLFVLYSRNPVCLGLAGLVGAIPPLLIIRCRTSRRQKLESQIPGFLIALADGLTTVPNLGQALESTAEYLEDPMREEIVRVLSQTRIGRSLDEALEQMARHLCVPGIEAAISAALLGRRTGGDLSAILRRIAHVLREMARLEGVIRTKTSEGRNQAVAMGVMPIVLILALEKIDPDWLAPLWSDPAGWLIVGAAAVLEVSAVALIRRITAVNI